MKILQNVLLESKEYYLDTKKKIEKMLGNLPKGAVKSRKISGKKYYYLQYRLGKKIIQKYLGKNKPTSLIGQIKERKVLIGELEKVKNALKIIERSKGRKNDRSRY